MSFDPEARLNLLNNELFLRYKNMLNADIYEEGGLRFNRGILNKTLRPPQLINVQKKIEKLKSDRRVLIQTYYDIHATIVNQGDAKQSRREYEEVMAKIYHIDNEVDKLLLYQDKLNKDDDIESKLKLAVAEKEALEAKLQKKRSDHKRIIRLHKSIVSMRNNDQTPYIDYFIDILPVPVEAKDKKEPKNNVVQKHVTPEVPKPIKPVKVSKPVKTEEELKPSKPQLTKDQVDDIKNNVKKLIGDTFKFKSREECTSQKRSQPYYMSKENILKAIENNPDIKKQLPAGYKTLSKDDLCAYLTFEKN
jgi:hypothetical protein